MSWEPAGFMFFSTLEGVGIFAMMMSFFRLKATDYIWPALFIILLMNLQSYVLRNDLELANLVPLVNILLFIFLLNTVVKIPVIWSAIITIAGYLAFIIIQVLLVIIVFGSLQDAESSMFRTYSAQTMSGLLCIVLAWVLYKFGVGFTFDFEKLRLHWEGTLVIGLILLFLLVFSIIVYKNELWLYIISSPIALMFLLYYAVRKERLND